MKKANLLKDQDLERHGRLCEHYERQLAAGRLPDLTDGLDPHGGNLTAAVLANRLFCLYAHHWEAQSDTPTLVRLRLSHPDFASLLDLAYYSLKPLERAPNNIDGLTLTEYLSSGAQGVVYRGYGYDNRSNIAVKFTTNPGLYESLEQEEKILARVRSSHVADLKHGGR